MRFGWLRRIFECAVCINTSTASFSELRLATEKTAATFFLGCRFGFRVSSFFFFIIGCYGAVLTSALLHVIVLTGVNAKEKSVRECCVIPPCFSLLLPLCSSISSPLLVAFFFFPFSLCMSACVLVVLRTPLGQKLTHLFAYRVRVALISISFNCVVAFFFFFYCSRCIRKGRNHLSLFSF